MSPLVMPALVCVALAGLGCGPASNPGKTLTGAGGTGVTGAAGTPITTGVAGNTGPGTGGTTGTGGTPVTAGTGGSTGTGGTPGNPGACTAGAGVAVCTSYCTTMMTNCTGVNQQYADMADCMKVCSYIPAGTPTDQNANSVGCRASSAKAAAMDTMQYKSECFAAGPLSYGTCGNDCEAFCNVAQCACATAPYASADDCNNTCGQFMRQVQFGMPGTYNASYMPGTTPETKDTLECRAFHLLIKGLPTAGGLATECPNAANVSAACGSGVVPIDTDAGTTTPDGPIPTFDGGGTAKSINTTNCNDTLFPPMKRKMLLRDEGDPHMVMIDLSKTPILQWKSVAEGPWARAGQLIGNNEILGGTSTGYQVWDYATGTMKKQVSGFTNTQSAYRMVTGETMLTTSGTVLKFLDKTDKVSHQISYPGYSYVRVARPTRKGTFLVPSDNTVFEGDATGKVLWKLTAGASGWGHIWEPLLLGPPPAGAMWKDGDTLLCTAFGSSCDVIDQVSHTVKFRYGTKTMPEAATVKPNFFSEFEILPNGHIFTANWQGHGGGNGNSGIQVLEFDPTGKLVWFWKQDATIFSSIQGVQMMDCKNPMYLHVEETSPDSTWQPVMPTP